VGGDALLSNTTASYNTAVGYFALYNNTTGTRNTAMGAYDVGSGYGAALQTNTTGSNNAAYGVGALQANSTASNNSAFGTQALITNSTGAENTAVGFGALRENTTASNNTAVGYAALYYNTTGANNVAVGQNALANNTTAAGNTAIGVGSGSLITTGQNNTILGRYNGNQGGLDIRTANNNIVLSDGDGNVRMYVSSSGGTVINGVAGDGYSGVGASNTMYAIPASGAYALGVTQVTTSASGGRVLGLRNVTDFNNSSNEVINYNGNATTRFLVTSNGNVTNTNNSYGAISDIKLKEQITDASSQWNDIKSLTVRKYKMKDEVIANGDSDELWRLGVVAQEIETAGMNGLVEERIDYETNEDGNIVEKGTTTKQVKYSVLYMKAVKALQEAMDRIETLEAKVAALESN
jgi:trimeric autotransporter adhesin